MTRGVEGEPGRDARDSNLIDWVAEVLSGHGWSVRDALDLARKARVAWEGAGCGTRCASCGGPSELVGARHGVLCPACFLELECNVILPQEREKSPSGRRILRDQEEPSSWDEHAARGVEDR